MSEILPFPVATPSRDRTLFPDDEDDQPETFDLTPEARARSLAAMERAAVYIRSLFTRKPSDNRELVTR